MSVHAVTRTTCPATVLLVDANAAAARRIKDVLNGTGGEFRVEWVTTLHDALTRLAGAEIEVVLVGQHVLDCEHTDAFHQIEMVTPDALILPLSEPGVEQVATDEYRQGEHHLASESCVDVYWLPQALRYVTQRRKTEAGLRAVEEALFEEKERAQVTLNSIGDAVLVTDLQGNVTYVNPMAEVMTGWTCMDALGQPLPEVFNIIDGNTRKSATNPAQRAMEQDRTVGLAANCVLVRRDGGESGIEDSVAPVHDRDGRVSGAVIVFRDVSQSRARARKMAYMAQHDILTGLPNRALLSERLTQAMRLGRRHQKQVALLFVDLVDFKQINDSLGHVVGDHVLRAVANTLTTSVRATDTVCRQGGDEFVILLSEIEKPGDASYVAGKLLTAFAAPMLVDGYSLRVAMSIGISIFPDDGEDVDTILQHADTAMYRAKANGPNSYDFFRTDIPDSTVTGTTGRTRFEGNAQ